MSEKKLLLKNLSSLGVIQIANLVLPLISVPIIARVIGPDNYGVIQYSYTVVLYFNLLIGYSFSLTGIRRLNQNIESEDHRSKVFNQVLNCQFWLFLFSTIVIFLLMYSLPTLSSDKKVLIFTYLLSVSVLFTQNWFFQAMQDLTKIMILNLLGKLLYLVMVILIITQRNLYFWQPLSLGISQIFVALISFSWVLKLYNVKIKFLKLKEVISILWVDRYVFFNLILTSTYVSLIIIILGFIETSTDIGYYTSAQKLILVTVQLVSLPLSQVLYPYLSKIYVRNKNSGVFATQKFIPIIFIGSLIASFVIYFLAEFIILFFFGKEFIGAVEIFKILSFVPMLTVFNRLIGVQFLTNLSLDHLYFKGLVIGSFFCLVLSSILIFNFGVKGAAFSWLITELLIFVILNFFLRKMDIMLFNKELIRPKYLLSLFTQLR